MYEKQKEVFEDGIIKKIKKGQPATKDRLPDYTL
jgi:hypothetical protein